MTGRPQVVESTIIKLAVCALGFIGLTSVMFMGLLAFAEHPKPAGLEGVAGAAIGALATLLTTFSPAPVVGGRRASDPVPELENDELDQAATLGPVGISK